MGTEGTTSELRPQVRLLAVLGDVLAVLRLAEIDGVQRPQGRQEDLAAEEKKTGGGGGGGGGNNVQNGGGSKIGYPQNRLPW